jgi:hypothetical protein
MNPKDILQTAQQIAQPTISNKKKAGLVWFATEIVQIIIYIIGSLTLLWLYAPFSTLAKFGLSMISMIVVYDVFKNFVYVRYILWKESVDD